MIKASEENLAAVSSKTIVIPGHGNPVSSRGELSAFRDMLVAIRENVAKLRQQGRSLDETVAAKPTAAFDAKWGQSSSRLHSSHALSMKVCSCDGGADGHH